MLLHESRIPLGYDYGDGTFTPNDQAGTVRTIFDSFSPGSASTRSRAN